MFILEANASKPYNLGFKLHFRSKKKQKKTHLQGKLTSFCVGIILIHRDCWAQFPDAFLCSDSEPSVAQLQQQQSVDIKSCSLSVYSVGEQPCTKPVNHSLANRHFH